jgi:PAS domain S-box-containing protein
VRKKGLHALKMELASLEERLRDAELELSNERALAWGLLNALDDPVFIKDRAHRWVFLNDAACLLWKRPRESLLGKTDHELFPKDQADCHWEKDDMVFETENPLLTEEVQTIAGRLHTVSTRKSIYRDPRSGEPYVIGVMRDISEYKRAIEAFRESQVRYRTLLEAIPGGVFVLDRELRFVLVNSTLCRMLKAPESEILYTKLDTVVPDIWDTAFNDAFREALAEGKAGRAVDEIRSRDGEHVFYEVSVYPVPEGILGIARRIAAERVVEERLWGGG